MADRTPGGIAFAILLYAAGDVLIAAASLVAALVLLGAPDWPGRRFGPVAAAAVAIGIGYAIFGERLNVAHGRGPTPT